MSYNQPRLGFFNATSSFFTQQPSQPVIRSLPETRLNESVQNTVLSEKSALESVTRITETKKAAADREVIVLSDSESDTETREPVVSRKMKGKGKENDSCANDCQYVDIDSLSSNVAISKLTSKKNLPDNYALMSNKDVSPVRVFLNILKDHKTNVGLFDVIVDFTRIFLEIYDEDKRIITRLQDLQALVADLIYCLTSKMKDDHYMATSKRFKQVELLAQKTIGIIENLKETGEISKNIDGEAQLHNEKKRRIEEENSLQGEKRRKYEDDRGFVNERERGERGQGEKEQEGEGKGKEREQKRREYKRQELWNQRLQKRRILQEEKRLRKEREKREKYEKKLKELEKQTNSLGNAENCMKTPPPFDYPSMPGLSQYIQYEIPLSQPRKCTKGEEEAEFVELLAEPLHDLITTQVLYYLYKDFGPFYMSETVNRCNVSGIFRRSHFEKRDYCKQLYRQYIDTNMDDTIKVIESWIKVRISENVAQALKQELRKNF